MRQNNKFYLVDLIEDEGEKKKFIQDLISSLNKKTGLSLLSYQGDGVYYGDDREILPIDNIESGALLFSKPSEKIYVFNSTYKEWVNIA